MDKNKDLIVERYELLDAMYSIIVRMNNIKAYNRALNVGFPSLDNYTENDSQLYLVAENKEDFLKAVTCFEEIMDEFAIEGILVDDLFNE